MTDPTAHESTLSDPTAHESTLSDPTAHESTPRRQVMAYYDRIGNNVMGDIDGSGGFVMTVGMWDRPGIDNVTLADDRLHHHVTDLLAETSPRPGSTIIDIGCGDGKLARYFDETLDDPTIRHVGIDLAMHRSGHPPAIFANALRLPLRPGSIQAACVVEVGFHMNRFRLFGELASVLESDGHVVTTDFYRPATTRLPERAWKVAEASLGVPAAPTIDEFHAAIDDDFEIVSSTDVTDITSKALRKHLIIGPIVPKLVSSRGRIRLRMSSVPFMAVPWVYRVGVYRRR